jgi:hypothetical protein
VTFAFPLAHRESGYERASRRSDGYTQRPVAATGWMGS